VKVVDGVLVPAPPQVYKAEGSQRYLLDVAVGGGAGEPQCLLKAVDSPLVPVLSPVEVAEADQRHQVAKGATGTPPCLPAVTGFLS
jgi:hypothetical protein